MKTKNNKLPNVGSNSMATVKVQNNDNVINESDSHVLSSFFDTVETLKSGAATYSMTNVELTFSVDTYRQNYGVMDGLVETGIVAALRQLAEDDPGNVTFVRVCNILLKLCKRVGDIEGVELIREYKKQWKLFLGREEPLLRILGSKNIRTNRDMIKFLSYSGSIHTDFHNGLYAEREQIKSTEGSKFLRSQLISIMLVVANLSNALIEDFIEVRE